MRRWTIIVAVVALLAVALLATGLSKPEIRWRADVLWSKSTGDLPGITFFELVGMLMPGSPFYLEELARGGSPYSVIANPFTSADDRSAGEELYRTVCSACHDQTDQHGAPLSLFDGEYAVGDSDWALYLSARDGIPGTAMAAQDLTELQLWQTLAYIRAVASTAKTTAIDPGSPFVELAPVSFDRIAGSAQEPHNWLTYSGALDGSRFSRLARIDKDNVSGLKLDWVHQGRARDLAVEATPLVVDGIMISTEPPNEVIALDARTGRLLWRYAKDLPSDLRYCCGPVNRGVTVFGDTVFVGTLDAHLLALNIRTGRLRWDVETADHSLGYSNTAAPLAVDGLIIVGMAGGEFGTRGFIDAYDPQTGERRWRFWTVPEQGDGEPASWSGDSWKTGGGPTWMTGSYDAGLLYWGVGNPGPDFNDETRQGDNLYTNSVVALDADSGSLRWYFQFTPGDVFDYDANHVPVIADVSIRGISRRVLMMATKNGFYYVLDAATGEFLLAKEFTRQTWARGIDGNGRPIRNPDAMPSATGTRVYPGSGGGTNWWPPSYNATTSLLYLPVSEKGSVFFSGDRAYVPGELFVGGSSIGIPGEPNRTLLRAIEPGSGEIVWEFDEPAGSTTALTGGVLSVASGIVFWGNDTSFFALDANTGEELWSARLGGRIIAAPMTYALDGRQYVTVAAGRGLFTFSM